MHFLWEIIWLTYILERHSKDSRCCVDPDFYLAKHSNEILANHVKKTAQPGIPFQINVPENIRPMSWSLALLELTRFYDAYPNG